MFKRVSLYSVFYFLGLILLICLLYLQNRHVVINEPYFVIKNSSATITHNSTLYFESFLIPEPQFLKVSHSSSIEVLSNGDLIATWFAGSKEGQPDVKIWQSKFHNGAWSYAVPIVTREMLNREDGRFTSKLGNPVLYLDNSNKLHLFVVSVGLIGGWSGSNINHFVSLDNGKNWHFVGKLYLSPFANISTLDRTRAVSLTSNGFYLPVYHEMIRKYPEILYFNEHAQLVSQIRLTAKNNLIQPALLIVNSKTAFVYLRNSSNNDDVLYYQITNDGGLTWSNIKPTNLINQNSSIAVDRINESQYLMVHNIKGRDELYLSWSNNGYEWRDFYSIEKCKAKEYSYPAIQIHNNYVDITYTYNRNAIKHLRFNLNWLYNQLKSVK